MSIRYVLKIGLNQNTAQITSGQSSFEVLKRKWQARSQSERRRLRNGEWAERKTRSGTYFCNQEHVEMVSPDCPRNIGSKKADDNVWEKVCMAISNPDILLAQAYKMVDELQIVADSLDTEQ